MSLLGGSTKNPGGISFSYSRSLGVDAETPSATSTAPIAEGTSASCT
eukprot:CAMPEP_0118930190 /NCGR_PEP_ID=MMETSP1169-20130426/6959_1 /TAXON_ID=36882 /ORGANISM="Pyramimonas obovata, Strain CCMP722" /LENGTH=46 /DNA_ID= /DNA_START= /DNA_END= /DNA_ORIENTATION=